MGTLDPIGINTSVGSFSTITLSLGIFASLHKVFKLIGFNADYLT